MCGCEEDSCRIAHLATEIQHHEYAQKALQVPMTTAEVLGNHRQTQAN
jgi:hypothetical protein